MRPKEYIRKADLQAGEYYAGVCRNASMARWDADKQVFVHWRTKFSSVYLETICHPEDDQIYDVFFPVLRIETPKEIPLGEENAPVRTISQDPAA